MPARIFDDKLRTDPRPCRYSEGTYAFYDRSSWPLSENVRTLLNSWLLDFPVEGQAALAKRFRTEFDAAFFELLWYTVFRRLGFQLTEHPVLPNTTKHCDFKVTGNDRSFFLECISTNGLSAEEEARLNTKNFFYDLLDDMDCPDFYLRLADVSFGGKRTPAFKVVRKELQELISRIDPDSIDTTQIRNFSELPAFLHQDPDFRLQLGLIPKPAHRRTGTSRNIGVSETRTHVGGFGHVLLDAIKRKAARYGRVGAPFLLAINALTELPIDDFDIEDALYDHHTAYVPRMLKGMAAIPQHLESGFLTHGRWIHTRLSAVLFTRANPGNLLQVPYWIYYHPMAVHPLDFSALPLSSHQITGDGVRVIAGSSLGELLGLPADWPGEKIK